MVELLAVGVDLGAVGADEAVGENICVGRGKHKGVMSGVGGETRKLVGARRDRNQELREEGLK